MVIFGQGCNLLSAVKVMHSGVSTMVETGNTCFSFDSNTLLEDQDGMVMCSYDVSLRVLRGAIKKTRTTPANGNAPKENGVSEPKDSDILPVSCTTDSHDTPAEATVTGMQHLRSQIRGMRHESMGRLLEAVTSSPATKAILAGVNPHPSQERYRQGLERHHQRLQCRRRAPHLLFARVVPAVSPVVAPSAFAGVAPNSPHQVTASTNVQCKHRDTFDSAPTKGSSKTEPPVACVNFAYTDQNPLRVSEAENRGMKTLNIVPTCHLLPRVV